MADTTKQLIVSAFTQAFNKHFYNELVVGKLAHSELKNNINKGDEVDVTMPGLVTLFDYDGGDLPTAEAATLSTCKVKIDRGKAFHFELSEMEEKMISLLGGRAAEKIALDDISTGASNDLEVATKIAKDMVTVYGMSENLGPISLKTDDPNELLIYGEKIEDVIGAEVKILMDTAYNDAQKILLAHMDELNAVAKKLLEKEVISGREFYEIVG